MTSNTTIATSQGGGVSWQADIPGLASLALTMGRSGLKKLAQAGVDFHTIVCMSEIAEKCPASIEYRREISECRQAQRSETQLLYKVVELGAGTNFVADELLKNRAGENVVALLSAVLSVMSEKSCDNLLLKLFEAAGSDLDSTPGFAQLRSFRESLTPLAKRMEFKDRVFQYHVLSRNILEHDTNSSESHAYNSIPNEETAVKVIIALSKLVQDDLGSVLDYYGLPGSGWVIAYARHVLGLPVCVVSSPSNAVPVSGDYQSSRVLVHIYKAEGGCKLLMHGKVQDFFVTRPLGLTGCNGWQIDIGVTNVLDSYIPRSDPMRKVCAVIARSLTHDYTETLTNKFAPFRQDFNFCDAGLQKYSAYCLPQVRQRAQDILTLFTFETNEDTEMYPKAWTNYISLLIDDNETPQRMSSLMPTSAWDERQLGHIEASEDPTRRFDERGTRNLTFLFRLVEAASWLAFTNWDQNVRLLSTNFIEAEETWWRSGRLGISILRMIESVVRGEPLEFGWSTNSLYEIA